MSMLLATSCDVCVCLKLLEAKAVEAALLGELGLTAREVCGLHEIALVAAADRCLVILLLAEGCELLRVERLPLGEVLHRLAVEPELALAGLALGALNLAVGPDRLLHLERVAREVHAASDEVHCLPWARARGDSHTGGRDAVDGGSATLTWTVP